MPLSSLKHLEIHNSSETGLTNWKNYTQDL